MTPIPSADRIALQREEGSEDGTGKQALKESKAGTSPPETGDLAHQSGHPRKGIREGIQPEKELGQGIM